MYNNKIYSCSVLNVIFHSYILFFIYLFPFKKLSSPLLSLSLSLSKYSKNWYIGEKNIKFK